MPLLSNLDVYWSVAEQAHVDMQQAWAECCTLKPGGEAGYVIRWDPQRRSFKSAIVCIVFCGMVLDAAMFQMLQKRFGRGRAMKVDRKPHEERLLALGVSDPRLLERVANFREARKDLVHEKAVELHELSGEPLRSAQRVADEAMALLRELRAIFISA